MKTNEITGAIVDSAMAVHTALGPGLPESTCQACRTHEPVSLDIAVQKEVV